jgi:hypothetical protein
LAIWGDLKRQLALGLCRWHEKPSLDLTPQRRDRNAAFR